jgi:chromosome segregation ATPase
MSEERFDKFEKRFDAVDADIDGLKTDVAELKTDVAELKTDVAELKTDVAELKTDVAGLKTDVRDLRRHMGVLHEEVLDRIRGIGENDGLRREMRAGFAEMRQMFLDHTIPGDAADRQFAVTLADHEKRIGTLESR